MLSARLDPELGLSAPTSEARYPVTRVGYMEVASVEHDASPLGLAAGTRVAMTYGHRTGWVGEPLGERVVPLPADLDPLLGVFVVHMGPIDANGLLHAAADQHGPDVRALGDGVCAGGGSPSWAPGTVGRLTALFTPPRSGEVVVVEPTARRRAAAEALGVEALDPDGADPALVPKTRCGTAGVHLDFRNA